MGQFKPHFHIPQISKVILVSLGRPILAYFVLLGNAVTFFGAYLFYHFEEATNPTVENYWDSVWWAFCTISTVGYGDIVPITLGGRIVGIFLIIVGVGFFLSSLAIMVSVIGQILIEGNSENS